MVDWQDRQASGFLGVCGAGLAGRPLGRSRKDEKNFRHPSLFILSGTSPASLRSKRTELLSGGTYVNVTSIDHADGEIRGQLAEGP
jgi:hypothetical protein